jgi:hypothetical protein
MNAQQTNAIILPLLTIDHADLPTPIRLVRNTQNIVSRSNTYTAFLFQMNMPQETGDKIPSMKLTLDNVDRRFTAALRSLNTPATVTYEAILADSPNEVEVGPYNYTMSQINIDESEITIELTFEDLLNATIPNEVVNPLGFPGVFA